MPSASRSTSVHPPRRNLRSIVLMAAAFSLYLAADLGTKEWAIEQLSEPRPPEQEQLVVCEPTQAGYVELSRRRKPPVTLIDGYLRLHYTENCGASFSMLGTAPGWVRHTVFGLAAIVISVLLTLMFVRGSGGALLAAGIPMILAGAVGNLVDRVRHGFVVDFLQVDPSWFRYPIFNVADIWIAVGVGLLILDGIVNKPKTVRVEES